MIPTIIDTSEEIQTFDIQTDASMPTLTHRMDLKNNRVQNWVDGQEAMKQAIFKILQTERYRHNKIYSDNYGVELADLFGMSKIYVIAEVERRIREALLWDERITAIKNFVFDVHKGNIVVRFECDTVFGEVGINNFEVDA